MRSSNKTIRFFHRGRVVEVDGPPPTRTVLDWLREDARSTGTKEGCNEGDCGACTVVIGELADAAADGADARGQADGLRLRAVNACLQFLPTLDGKALFTVEDLARLGAAPHPVQQAMVACHASQCGFCTPGFVMSLWSVYEHHQARGSRPTRQQLADALAGNLCRCTGYRPILDAGERMFELPEMRLDAAPVARALRALRRDETLVYGTDGARFHAPRTLDELAALRECRPGATLLAGGTDVGLWVNKQLRDLGEVIWLGGVAELQRIEAHDGALWIGAGASLEDAWAALARRHPPLTELWLRFGSPPVRHAGTMGGNIANGSPIGDAAPVLMALDAQIELRQGDRVRRMPLADFYLDYMKNRLEAGEFVQALAVPDPPPAFQVRAYKISKRLDSDISALCGAFAIVLEDQTVGMVRLAFGGMAATVRRAARAEAALAGQPWSLANVRRAQAALAADFEPLTDLRASTAYRMRVAQNLIERFWWETRAADPLDARATRVWRPMEAVE